METARFVLLAGLLVAGRSFAGTPTASEPDKSGYDLFHPVPDDLLRDLDTDRPDKTNSPRTLDAGHLQIEMGLADFTSNTDSGIRTRSWTWLDTDTRIGLTNWAELQLELPLYQVTRETDLASDETEHSDGIGDLSVVTKINFWGNDGDATAGGIELFVTAPTAAHGLGNGRVEGGAMFLFAMPLPGDFELGINNGFGIVANDDDDDDGIHAEIVNSIVLLHPITGSLSGYVEFFSAVPTRRSADWEGTVDFGSTWTIGRNFQFDGGLNVGITHAADDLQPFLGASYRF